LQFLIGELDHIPHLKWLRIHTRMPVVVPDRITPSLIRVISGSRMKQTVVIHANHPNEIDTAVGSALASLHRSGIQLLNQSVLLKWVNDDALVLVELSERLYSNHVLPYYLHMLDPVAGAAHFEVPESTAVAIMDALRSRLPGYLVPRLVREMEGEAYKTPVGC
jgi:KamA family protein